MWGVGEEGKAAQGRHRQAASEVTVRTSARSTGLALMSFLCLRANSSKDSLNVPIRPETWAMFSSCSSLPKVVKACVSASFFLMDLTPTPRRMVAGSR